jgi:hypothetical protein
MSPFICKFMYDVGIHLFLKVDCVNGDIKMVNTTYPNSGVIITYIFF